MKTIITSILTLSFTFATLPARAQEIREPTKGSGKLVSGILVTSIGSAIGGLMLLFGTMGMECHDDEEECDKNDLSTTQAGLLIGGASLGVGIPLIVMGARERREWKDWKKTQIQTSEDRHTSSSLGFSLKPLKRGGLAALTFEY